MGTRWPRRRRVRVGIFFGCGIGRRGKRVGIEVGSIDGQLMGRMGMVEEGFNGFRGAFVEEMTFCRALVGSAFLPACVGH